MRKATKNLMTTAEFAEEVGLTQKRINQLLTDGEIKGEMMGGVWLIESKFIEVIKNRPERRGRPKRENKAA